MRLPALGTAGIAVTAAAVIGALPPLAAGPQLAATLHYLRGTNIGDEPTEDQFRDFIGTVIDGTGIPGVDPGYRKVPYNAGFRPFSHGGFTDLTYDASVAQAVALLQEQDPAHGDVIFGFSQGAVAASQYKATHTGDTYLLVENPSRPNGGVMQRFDGLVVPFLNVTFTGATPNNGVDGAPGDLTIDIARQYDGWADFPTYLWNPVAVANAVMGILLVHGDTQTELTVADLQQAQQAGSDYYQHDPASNTTYYVIKTYPVPLLMPLDPILPDPVIAALDRPLRKFIELAYDRSDYSAPTRAKFFMPLVPPGNNAGAAATADDTVDDTADETADDDLAAAAAADETAADDLAAAAVAPTPVTSRGAPAVESAPGTDPGPDEAAGATPGEAAGDEPDADASAPAAGPGTDSPEPDSAVQQTVTSRAQADAAPVRTSGTDSANESANGEDPALPARRTPSRSDAGAAGSETTDADGTGNGSGAEPKHRALPRFNGLHRQHTGPPASSARSGDHA
ncbi:PE-PPE domain-containing protein [Mycolicibacterium palauense]|uniref:PE-PPE domain-containing protein n=1 Tax=Mycolicibacterium palauense TaxID=2034511 RepID=UPI001FEAD8FB|nr:PE-PPE domain-containing protein [Mycolicibacterium palauense]